MIGQQQQQSHGKNLGERVTGLERDVAAITNSLSDLGADVRRGFDAIGSELTTRSAFNWQPISILVVVIIAVAGWSFALFGSYQSRTDAAIAEQKLVSARFVDRADINDKFDQAKQKNDLRQKMTDARVERIERDIERISKDIVPHGEYAEQWAHQHTTDENLRRSVEQVRLQLVELNSPRDIVQEILKRLDDIDRAVTRRK